MSMPPGLDRILAYVIALEAERARRESTLLRAAEAAPPPIAPVPVGRPRPELSIVVPVWNPRPEHFRRCLASIAAARLESITHEIVISDDASSDVATARELVATSSLHEPRFVRQERNLGGFGNFNWCLTAARGTWVHMLHQDDWVEPDFYTELLRGPAQSSGADLRFCRTHLFFEDANETRLMFDEAPTAGILADFLHRQTISQRVQIAGAILNRDALSSLGGYDPRLGAGGDWEFWIRWGARHSVFHSPRPLATYSLHRASWSTRDTTGAARAESLALHRHVLIRSLLHLNDDLRQHAATGFYRTLSERLLAYVRENNRNGQSPVNRALLTAFAPATIAHGLGSDLERLIGLVR
jgi:glycosyltransferase involved in cell wall biosynthesis